MADIIEHIGSSVLQHGFHNNRIYVMKFDGKDHDIVFERIYFFCKENNYSKIVIKASRKDSAKIISLGYKIEADIPNYFNGKNDCILLSKYLSKERSKCEDLLEIKNIISISKGKRVVSSIPDLPAGYSIRSMKKNDVKQMTVLYKKVFKSYPFPIFDTDYLAHTMKNDVEYAGIFYKKKLVSLASAEKDSEYKSAEMTDFATLPDHQGNGFALTLLDYLEKAALKQGFKVLYTIARSLSPGMNITFKKKGYTYTGTLINNTNISGRIESMNVWYKNLELAGHLMQIFSIE